MTEDIHPEGAILSAALELEADARAAYLDEACAGDAALRQRVEGLLRAHAQAEGFLESSTSGLEPYPGVTAAVPALEKTGDSIGPYKLLQQIGEGGCGVVYMAEQKTPIHRRVALKVIKPGMDTKQVIARFDAERQALALMDHPNIAKVLDAGATQSGRPYFVMDLVRGVKITDFCDEQNLSTEERLRLFIQVCQAVQHAHQKGVIHRDIKPSNILVTMDDSVPVPKVIDFGIAKATQGRLTDQTVFTAFEQFIGTPAYMSPEQAVLTSLDVDTRSDIYSLGVLLYELLTGSTPFDQKALLAVGMDEMRRTIREKEPPKPSTRLSSMAAEALTTTAKRRRTDAPKLIHLVRGDLDWIVMKCLEKDRSRRYETANGLATDIQRHLDCEPVVARPPSKVYRVGKFLRKHRVAVTAVTSVAVAVVAGLVLAVVGFAQARRERQQAEEKATVAMEVSAFLQNHAFGQETPGHSAPAEAMLVDSLNRDRSWLTNSPLVEVATRLALGHQYLASGEPGLALPHVERALEISRRLNRPFYNATCLCMEDRLEVHGALGAWAQCLADCREIVQFAPQLDSPLEAPPAVLYQAAAAALLTGDNRAYREFAGYLLALFGGTSDPDRARDVALVCLLTPDPIPGPRSSFSLADLAPQGSPLRYQLNKTVKGLAEYRQGNLTEAMRWLEEPRRGANPFAASLAGYLCAMIHSRQGHTNEPPIDRAEADKRLAAFLQAGDLRSKWVEEDVHAKWIGYGYVATIRTEAERLLLGRSFSPIVDGAWLESARKRWAPVRTRLAVADGLAGQMKWGEARAEYLAAMQEPTFDWETAENLDRELASRMGITFLLANDRQGHEQLCRDWFSRLDAHPDPNNAFFAAKLCLAASIDPTTDVGRRATNWSRTIAWRSGSVALVRAMAAYRAGQYADAIEQATPLEQWKWLGEQGTSQAFRAMALAKLGRTDEGRAILHKTETRMHPYLSDYSGDGWWDLGLCQLALAEARRLFGDTK